jgi:hypothetical protein
VNDTRAGEAAVYIKVPPDAHSALVALEYICAELARLIRLPVPPSFVAELPQKDPVTVFATLGFNLSGSAPAPVAAETVAAEEPDICTGVVLFDAWVVNSDRHVGNLSFKADRPPHRVNVFDHSHALTFYPDCFKFNAGKLGITGEPGRGNRHCLLDGLTTARYVPKWLGRIRDVPKELITEIVEDAADLGLDPALVAPTVQFLVERRNSLGDLIDQNRDQFRGISDWPTL